jgi:glucose-6-phosphate dehydrogenase assembly protein OpcA
VLPLLGPDTPVVTWWPGAAPRRPGHEPLGALAQRRVTDAAGGAEPLEKLVHLAEAYKPGDTDFAWARITPWRSLLAAALDQPHEDITGIKIEAEQKNPSAALLGGWLGVRLGVPCEVSPSYGPGITGVRLFTQSGEIAVARPDGRVATLSRPDQPDRQVALHRRSTAELLAEELRRLDPDEVYHEAVARYAKGMEAPAKAPRRPAKAKAKES